MQQNEYHILGWESLGATPTPFAFNELYTALQQGTVDAQENPIELIYSQKFYEQQSYITLTNHQQQGPAVAGERRPLSELVRGRPYSVG